jgi:transcriptional regulator with XRE-family HTH domain
MADMYKIIDDLLTEKGISGVKMSTDLGMSRSFMTELRKGRAKSIKLETAQKIADYLGVSVSALLGEEEKNAPSARGSVTDEDIKFALFGGDGEITDEMYEEVKRFAAYLKEKNKE